ncbi:uncharacterized protein LOC125845670 [Solanum stenotomum]|uniref:uncharacterized protein LOC125845670 n=1 Tax=Solanum stenotomum TaxID=172797 RepID=UPI0020D1EA67|nr:uncharacterized protein LOC125845670 [Solanum stenotomum]
MIYDELCGNLMAYEQIHINRYNKDDKKKMVAFTAEQLKTRMKLMNIKVKKVQREAGYFISIVHRDHGGEFENKTVEEFCNKNGYTQFFSSPRSPQQNGVVERKSRSLQDTARTMLLDRNLPDHFWAEVVSTKCHILNRCLIRPIFKKTPYELWRVICRKVQREAGYFISIVHSDHGGEFENKTVEEFCNKNGYTQFFSSPRSPQQNGVVERKSRSLQDTARTMLLDRNLPDHFWAKVEIESTEDESTPLLSIEKFSNFSEKITIEESTTPEPKLTSPAEKTGIPREWRHNASYPNYFIMGKPTYSI